MYLRASLVWMAIVPVAILNGAFRQFALNPLLGDRIGHVISSLLLSALILLIAAVAVRPISASQSWRIGLLWLALTLLFEFVAGHWLFGQPWEKLLHDYDVLQGRVWVLVLAATLIAPVASYRLAHPGQR